MKRRGTAFRTTIAATFAFGSLAMFFVSQAALEGFSS